MARKSFPAISGADRIAHKLKCERYSTSVIPDLIHCNYFFVGENVMNSRLHGAQVIPRDQRCRQDWPQTEMRAVFHVRHAAVPTLWTTNPVSGGELKLVVSRSILPSALCERSRNCAARRIRSSTSPAP